jgi:hypothetical protein
VLLIGITGARVVGGIGNTGAAVVTTGAGTAGAENEQVFGGKNALKLATLVERE